MSTPLWKALRDYERAGRARFHMPGHKGILPAPLGQAAPYDVTEADGLDSLYESDGAIAALEEGYTELYGAGASLLSAGGATLCIQGMLTLAAAPGATVVLNRGCHRAAVHTAALLDLRVRWLTEQTPKALSTLLSTGEKPAAVYVTSPDYYGEMADIAGLARVAHGRGAPLLVDNAHGAHLRFLPGELHPLMQGADLCCDSLHKSLPVLTGGALLHLRDKTLRGRGKSAMALYGSSSPSYLIMLSADRCLGWLRGEGPARLAETAAAMAALRGAAGEKGLLYPLCKGEPLRLTLSTTAFGLSAEEMGGQLRRAGLEPEYVNAAAAVLMASPGNRAEDFDRLRCFLAGATPKGEARGAVLPGSLPRAALSLREAAFAPWEWVEVEKAAGRVAAALTAPCPPGMALAAPGEEIDGACIKLLKMYGVPAIKVVK